MICGLGFFALPIGIIASGFMDEYRRQDFIVTWGMAARTPIFASLNPREIADLLAVLKARTAPQGSLIASDGERPGALFMIGSGTVEIFDDDRPELDPVMLEEGQYWGARSLMTGVQAETAMATATCDLIVLDREDFATLGRTRPQLHAKLLKSVQEAPDPFRNAGALQYPDQS
jgi:voltage-gated potassium channel